MPNGLVQPPGNHKAYQDRVKNLPQAAIELVPSISPSLLQKDVSFLFTVLPPSSSPGQPSPMTVLVLFAGIGNGLAGANRTWEVCVSMYRVCDADPTASAVSQHNLNLASQ